MIERAKRIAQTVIRVRKLNFPVNISELIKKYASVEFEYDIPFKFDGLCFFNENKPSILINGNIPISRQKFTLAHELGHILIPGHKNIIACDVDNINNYINSDYKLYEVYSKYIQKEREANAFASELLMPSNYMKEITSNSKSFEEIIRKTNDLTDLSIQAITIRVVHYLKPGIVICIDYQNQGNPIVFMSNSTNLYKYDIDSNKLHSSLERKKLEMISKSISRFYFNNYNVQVYDIYYDIELETDIFVPEKKSTDILMELLQEMYPSSEAKKLFQRVNGIVANINSLQRINTMTKEEYYHMVKNKFRHRDGYIRKISETSHFRQYIAKRYDELS